MDSTEINKIAAALIGALLVFMLLGFFSGQVFGTRYHDHNAPQAFALEIEVPEVDTAADTTVDYAALIAAADLDAGKKAFNKCKACHKVEDGANGAGPHLWGVVGRAKEAADGFAYSGAIGAVGGEWDFASLNAFLEKPKDYAPGTSMAFAGLKKPEDRVNLIAWLNAEGGSNVDLAAGMEKAEAPAAEETEVAAAEVAETEVVAAPAAETTEAPAAEAQAETEAPAQEEVAAAPAAEEAPAETTEAPAPEATAPAAPAQEEVQVAAAGAYPAGDAKAGAKVFRKCRACHKVEDGKNGVGPHLWGVINREIASVDGYSYSDALAALPGNWTATEMDKFLTKPKSYVAGTKMAFGGLRKEEDRVNLITYLNEADGSPEPLE